MSSNVIYSLIISVLCVKIIQAVHTGVLAATTHYASNPKSRCSVCPSL